MNKTKAMLALIAAVIVCYLIIDNTLAAEPVNDKEALELIILELEDEIEEIINEGGTDDE